MSLAKMGWPHYRIHLRDCYTYCADQASCSRAEFEQSDTKYLRLWTFSSCRCRSMEPRDKGGLFEECECMHIVSLYSNALGK
jgi:hypothetical protein